MVSHVLVVLTVVLRSYCIRVFVENSCHFTGERRSPFSDSTCYWFATEFSKWASFDVNRILSYLCNPQGSAKLDKCHQKPTHPIITHHTKPYEPKLSQDNNKTHLSDIKVRNTLLVTMPFYYIWGCPALISQHQVTAILRQVPSMQMYCNSYVMSFLLS